MNHCPDRDGHFGQPGEETTALALILERNGDEPLIRLSFVDTPDGATVEPRPTQTFLTFLRGYEDEAIITGERLTWRLERVDAPL